MESKAIVDEAIKKNGACRQNLLPVLQSLYNEKHYLSKEDMEYIAKQFDMSPADVYGTASFYSFLDTKEMGKNIIRICKTISCEMKGKPNLVAVIEDQLKIKVGQTTPDKKFSLLETNCLGHCHVGPVMLINDDVYTELSPGKAIEILQKY